MIERMRQEKGPEEDQPLSYLPSASQGGAPAATEYDNHSPGDRIFPERVGEL